MTKFTPGPWHLEDARGEDNEHLFWEVLGDSEVYRGHLATLQHSESISGTTREENDANALLVSAAPELYDALDRIMHYARIGAAASDVMPVDQPEFINAVSALKKARGES